jgi:hypothetical protein
MRLFLRERTVNFLDFFGQVNKVSWLGVVGFLLISFAEDKSFGGRTAGPFRLLIDGIAFPEGVLEGLVGLGGREVGIRFGAVRAKLSGLSVRLEDITLPGREGHNFSGHHKESLGK